MKKIFVFLALAAAATAGISSCVHDGPVNPEGIADLVIQLNGVRAADTRAIEDPANETSAAVINDNSMIFVADGSGTITQAVAFTADATNGTGQTLSNPVSLDSKVYVVANIHDDDLASVKAKQTLDEVIAFVADVTKQTGFVNPTMANKTGAAVAVSTGSNSGSTITLPITIEPLTARVEIHSMKAETSNEGGNVITGFKVTGVFMDKWYPSFTYAGASSGTINSLGADLEAAEDAAKAGLISTFLGGSAMNDKGSWDAAGTPPSASEPTADKVWAYNLAASGAPAIIVELDNIVYKNASGTTGLTLSGKRYLTVVGFQGVSSIERGEVYVLGDEADFIFGFKNLGMTPYEEAASLIVRVTVEQWNVEHYTPVFN